MDNVLDGFSGKLEAVRTELANTQVQTDKAFARLTIAVRLQQQIFDLKKYSDFNGSEKSGPFLHITSEKLTHNLIDYYLFVGYNIDG